MVARFFKATSAEEVISALEKELDGAKVTNIGIGLNAILKRMPKVHGSITFTSGDERIVGEAEEMHGAFKDLNEDYDIVAVCLHGMGGIGKSTQAFSIFKKFQAMQVYRCCRVGLELETKRAKLPKLQREILRTLCKGQTPDFSDVEEGKEWMRNELPKCGAIFLYVDNVMEVGSLLQILPNSTYFARGSKIMITTRNKNVFYDFKKLGIEHCKCIEVKKLEKEVAKELFLNEIGGNGVGTSEEITSLMEEVLELCGGLPLALKVVGGYIANRVMGLEYWRDVVEKMKEAIPLEGEANNDPLYAPLKFSINELNLNFKRAFLDIVVFGHGQLWDYAERLVGKVCLEGLVGRSLIQWEWKESWESRKLKFIKLHDVMYTIGKQMARDDQSEIRITGEEDLLDNLGSLERIVGLSNIKISKADLLQQIPRLRLLHNVEIEVECEIRKLQHLKSVMISSSISRPIHFSVCSGLEQVTWYHANPDLEVFKGLQKLQALRIRGLLNMGAQIHNLQVIESLTSLKELRLCSFSSHEVLPEGISCLVGLTALDLNCWGRLQSLPEWIGCLTGLTFLDLHSCGRLQSLQEGIGCLTGLTTLHLTFCKSLQSLPEGIGHLTGLTSLDLTDCRSLQKLPEGISRLTGFTSLDLTDCRSLQSLPEGIGGLTGLTSVDLTDCRSLQKLPEGIGGLTGLTSLDLTDCRSLQSLPEGIGGLTGLTSLDLSGCRSLQWLPEGISGLTGLTSLDLSDCRSLQSLPEGIGYLTGLTSLDLRDCRSLPWQLPEGIGHVTGLTALNLMCCGSLELIPEGIRRLTGLTTLDLRGCGSVQSIPEGIGCLTGLIVPDLSDCGSSQSISEVDLSDCESLESLPEGSGSPRSE